MQPQINLLPSQPIEQEGEKPRINKKVFLTIPLILIPVIIISVILTRPVTEPTSPLANAKQPEIVRQSLQVEVKPLVYYLSASQEYLRQARDLSKASSINQTKTQKQKIISLLNESLKAANNAVKYYPQDAASYKQRSKLLLTISAVDPSAIARAEEDEKMATALGDNNQNININPQDLIFYEPIEEAGLLDTVAIALPDDDTVQENIGEEKPNAKKGDVVLPAGKTTVTVQSEFVTNDHLIYFAPEGDTANEVLTLKSKSEQNHEFTLKLSNPLPYDLAITWWIIE